MYLRGVQSLNKSDAEVCGLPSAHASGHPEKLGASQAGGQASAAPPKRLRRNPRMLVPPFFEPGVERVAWHVIQGHEIVLVSGTLEPLANAAARDLEAELAERGITTKIRLRATRLEESSGRFTGRIVGEAMFREGKARVVCALAQEMHLDLAYCYAYGDTASDLWMLEGVGHPTVVNPSRRLERVAQRRGWLVLSWNEEKELTQRTQSSRPQRETRIE